MDQEIIKKIYEKCRYISSSHHDGLLSEVNVYEIMAFGKHKMLQTKKDQAHYLNAFLD